MFDTDFSKMFPEAEEQKKMLDLLQDSIVEADPLTYEDSFFKELADDIKESQEQIASKIDDLAKESRKSSAVSTRIAIGAFVVAFLTLIATVYFGMR